MGGGKQPVNTFSFMNRERMSQNLQKCKYKGHGVKWYNGMVKFSVALGGSLWIKRSDASLAEPSFSCF